MSKSSILFILVASIILSLEFTSAEPPTTPTFTAAICDPDSGKYTSNSPYDTNLKTVVATLTQNSNTSTFFSSTSGTDPDTAYGQYYCRGDISSQLCSQCIQKAASAAATTCPQSKSVTVFFQECTLHYDDEPVSGVESITPSFFLASPTNVTDPVSFVDAANRTLNAVASKMGSEESNFGVGEGTTGSVTVYVLIQCSHDMNGTQCGSCLDSAVDVLVSCCGQWPSFLYVFTPSCQLMYDTRSAFYFTSPGASSPPPPSSTTTPPALLSSLHIPSL